MPHTRPLDEDGNLAPEDTTTQAIHPWRAVTRTLIAASIALIPIGTALIRELGLDAMPFFAGFIALGAAITRVLAMKETESFLNRHAPWLMAAPYIGRRRKDDKEHPQ